MDLDLTPRSLRPRSRPSIHSRRSSNLTDDQKEVIMNEDLKITKREINKAKNITVRTEDEENDNESNEENRSRANSESKSDDESVFTSEGSYKENSTLRNSNINYFNKFILKLRFNSCGKIFGRDVNYVFIMLILLPFASCVYYLSNGETVGIDIDHLKTKFPTQGDYLWIAFESGVNDVLTQKRPSNFILVYEDSAEKTLKELVENLSQYATCSITDCEKQAIVLTPEELNSPEILNDYGKIIEQNKNELSDRGVMIIENLQKVRGVSAQVFHVFCDEITPLVQKALFIFTMKVDKLPEEKNQERFVEDFFKRKWTDVKSDTLNALITRITSMVIAVRA